MGVVVVVGAQWGDEGKGKVVDFLAGDFDFVVRFHGGSNAGHTVRVGERTFKFSHLPSAVLRENCRLIIANGVVVEPIRLLEEIENLKAAGIDLTGRLTVSRDCHVTFPYHITMEAVAAAAKKGKWDPYSIRRGNGPTHADKAAYLGIRIGDLYHPKALSEKLAINAVLKRDLFRAFGHEEPSVRQLMEQYQLLAELLEPYVGETVALLHRALDKGARVLMEGAQGIFLDVDHGFYPFVTASNAVAGAVNAGAGIPPRAIKRVIGVAKAYVTRFGGGPFPTEMNPERAEAIRQKGGEIGVNLPEPRRVGW
ncbi:MAG: adenylosuccinate synthetase, partial [Patescibacteria group bacterium]